MENLRIEINIDSYDKAFSEWIISTFGKSMDGFGLQAKFDKAIGLCFSSSDDEGENTYIFKIIDERKFFLAKIKYGL